MLEVERLSVSYGPVRALEEVTFAVPAGTITAVLGANGAGKTTLLRTVSGLIRPRSGTVRLDGADITRAATESMSRRGLAHVPEGRGVITELTVLENLRLGELGRAPRGEPVPLERVWEMFPKLHDRRAAYASTLSGGERQMLVIARALLATPKVLLLDEPSLGLAPRVVAQIFDIIREINEAGVTVLLVEQNAAQALSLADRGYVLETGEIVLEGTGQELLADDRIRAAYLGEEIAH